MPIYNGVDGVIRKVDCVDVGVGGVVKTADKGFLGASGLVRQFLGPIEGLEYFRLSHSSAACYTWNDAAAAWSTAVYVDLPSAAGGTIGDYGSITFSGINPRIVAVNNHRLIYRGILYGVFADGHEKSLTNLAFIHGCQMSFPASIIWTRTGGTGGSWSNSCLMCGVNPIEGSVSTGKTYTPVAVYATSAAAYEIYAGVSIRGGSTDAQFQCSMDISTVSINGVIYPIKMT